MISRIVSLIAACSLPLTAVLGAGSGPEWTDVAEADKTLMGDYVGEWVNPEGGYQEINPRLCAQVINVDVGVYRLKFTQDHNLRAEIYFSGDAVLKGNAIVAKQDGWDIRVTESGLTGKGAIGENVEKFSLKRVTLGSPTMGQKPPRGAIVLFGGGDLSDERVLTLGARLKVWRGERSSTVPLSGPPLRVTVSGDRVAVSIVNPESKQHEVWVYDATGALRLLAVLQSDLSRHAIASIAITRDGEKLAFAAGHFVFIWTMPTDGAAHSATEARRVPAGSWVFHLEWDPAERP